MENLCPCHTSQDDHPACSLITILTTQDPIKQSASHILKVQSLFTLPSCTRRETEYYVHPGEPTCYLITKMLLIFENMKWRQTELNNEHV